MLIKYFLIIALLFGVWPQLSFAQEKPAPPTNVQAVPVPNVARITITWAASPTSGAFYRIYRSQYSDSNGAILVDDLNTLTYTDAAVVYNTTYYYRVAATLAGIESTLSAYSPAKPTLPIPINVKATDTKQGREIRISWDRPTMDIPLKYTIYRSSVGSELGGYIVNNLDAAEYLDKDVNNGTYYSYSVKSVYNTYTESNPSAPAGVTPSDATAPDRPTEVRVSGPDNGRVSVSWRAPSGESNLRFRVYRSSSPSGPGSQITETTSTSFAETLSPSMATYYYRVIALDAAYNESSISDAALLDMSKPTAVAKQQYKVSELAAEGTLNQGEIQLRWKMPNYSDIVYSRIYRRRVNVDAAFKAMIADRVYGSSYLDKSVTSSERYYYSIGLVDKNGYAYEASNEVSGTSFTEPSTTTPPAARVPPAAQSNQTLKQLTDTKNRPYAYGRPRMANLKLEAALANDLRQALIKKLGAKKVPARLNQNLIKAYIYGGYNVDEIAQTIVKGPGLVHSSVRAVDWRRTAEYKRHVR